MIQMRNIIHKQTTLARRGDFQQNKQNNVIDMNWLKLDLYCRVEWGGMLPTVDFRTQELAGDLHSTTHCILKKENSLTQTRESFKNLDCSQEGLS